MAGFKASELRRRAALRKAASVRRGATSRDAAFGDLLEDLAKGAPLQREYDIFLSHAYDDAQVIYGLKDLLEERGFSVYVDWLEDGSIDRTKVNAETADLLRRRMRCSKAMIVAYSNASSSSKWVTWEMAYFDGLRKGRVSVLPIDEEGQQAAAAGFKGSEFLQLYPVVFEAPIRGQTLPRLWVESRDGRLYASFAEFRKNGKLGRTR